MRTGCSELKYHTSIKKINGIRDVICEHCNLNRVENNYHFFFECSRYDSHRPRFMRCVSYILDTLRIPMSEKAMLGFLPLVMRHRGRKHEHKKSIIRIIIQGDLQLNIREFIKNKVFF